MIQLIWKDLRYYKMMMLGILGAMVMVYLLGPVIAATGIDRERSVWLVRVASNMSLASRLAIILSPVAVLLIAATAFSVERRERWIELSAMLPVSRSKLMISKLLVAILLVVAILASIIVMYYATYQFYKLVITSNDYYYGYFVGAAPVSWEYDAREILIYYAVCVASFGSAWLLSTLLRSPTFAFAIPLTLIILSFFWTVALYDGTEQDRFAMQRSFSIVSSILGILCLIAGCVIQSKRIEP